MSIIGFWSDFSCRHGPPYVHPADIQIFLQHAQGLLRDQVLDFDSFIHSHRFGASKDRRFHLSLLPVPYSGDLRRADIFILLLNPGVSAADYYAEYRSPAFRRSLLRKLRQDFDGIQYPFFSLDPQYCWTGAYRWWKEKLRQVARMIADEKYGGSYGRALQALSRRIATVELVPYHAHEYRVSRKLRDQLPSNVVARQYVREVLLPRGKRGKALIIVTRKADVWGLRPLKRRYGAGVVVYTGAQARGANLGTTTAGGRAILRRFGIGHSV